MQAIYQRLRYKLAAGVRPNSWLIGSFGSLPRASLSEQPSKELKAGEGDSCCWDCSKHVGQPALVEADHALGLVDFSADEAETIEGPQASDMHLGAHHLMGICDAGCNGLHHTCDEVSLHKCSSKICKHSSLHSPSSPLPSFVIL